MKTRVLTTGMLAMMGVASSVSAQITITNSIFPTAGTILPISSTTDVSGYSVTTPSPSATTWDFSNLVTENYREDEIMDAALGAAFAQFPNTEVTQPLLPGFGGTAYVDVSATQVNVVGGGVDLLGFAFVEAYDDAHKLQIAPLNFGTTYNDDFQLTLGAHIDSIPFLRQLIDSLAGSFLPFGISPDSIRLNIEGTQETRIDAFGTVIAHDGTYDVLRQKVEVYTDLQIEVRVDPPIFPAFWFDITQYLTSGVPFPLPTSDTTIYYDFLAEGNQQPIVRLNMENDESAINNIEFKGEHYASSVAFVPMTTPLRLFPNPANQNLNVEMGDFADINCQVQIVGIDGKIWLQQQSSKTALLAIPTANLPQGVYALTIKDNSGNLLRTEKLTIAR